MIIWRKLESTSRGDTSIDLVESLDEEVGTFYLDDEFYGGNSWGW